MRPAERVLVVEDDPLVAEAVLAALGELPGVEAVHVEDGRHALVRLSTDAWNLVLSDIELPNASGLEVLTGAKEADPDLPVVLMTAHQQIDYAIRAVRGSADEFLVKPIDPRELQATTRRLLGAARVGRESRSAAQRTVLAVGAHPDDVEVGCAGTLLEHRERGDRVVVLVLTGAGIEPRAGEAREAAAQLGIELVHGDLPDTSISEGGATIAAIAEQIERLAPEVVYTHAYEDDNPDHRSVHRATMAAVHAVPNVFAYQGPSSSIAFAPGRFVDVTPYLDRKLRTLREFRTQHAFRPYLDEELVTATARYWSRFAIGRFVEPFVVLRTSAPAFSPDAGPAARADVR